MSSASAPLPMIELRRLQMDWQVASADQPYIGLVSTASATYNQPYFATVATRGRAECLVPSAFSGPHASSR